MKKPEQTDQENEYVTFCGGIRPEVLPPLSQPEKEKEKSTVSKKLRQYFFVLKFAWRIRFLQNGGII